MEHINKKNMAARLFTALLALIMLLGMTGAISQTVFAESTDGFPFLLGAVKGSDNEIIPQMSYTFGSNPGTVPTDGTVVNYPLAETFANFETRPDSDHPDGMAYIWVQDDTENVYFVLDWTSDNTIDDGEDFFKVYIDDGAGTTVYTQHTDPVGGEYGVAVFGKTDTADYDHMWYAIAVPKSKLQSDKIKVCFELYGTAYSGGTYNWKLPGAPTTATVGVSSNFTATYTLTSNDSNFSDRIAFLIAYDDGFDLSALSEYGAVIDGESGGDITVLDWVIYPTATTGFPVTDDVTLSHTFTAPGEYKVAIVIMYLQLGYNGTGQYPGDIANHSFYNSETGRNYDYDAWTYGTPLTTTVTVTNPSAGIGINAQNFPDENFRGFLLAQPYGTDALLTSTEISGVTVIAAIEREIADFTGIGYFTSLEELYVGNNINTTLPALPTGLKMLYCGATPTLTSLPPLPPALEVLDCYVDTLQYPRGGLTQLPALPDTLLQLHCGGHQITSLPALPDTLEELTCRGNELTEMPLLPVSLRWIVCSTNHLTSLDLSTQTRLTNANFSGTVQRVYLELNEDGDNWSLPISLNTPTFGNAAVSYADGKLTCTNNAVTRTSFTVQTGLEGLTLSGTIYLTYAGPPSDFVPVTNITGIPETADAGTPLELDGTVFPSDATNRTITWSVKDAGTTGAAIGQTITYVYVDSELYPLYRDILNTTNPGTAVITATVTDGLGEGTDFTKDFTITVTGSEHTHTWETEWQKDATGHWHKCTYPDCDEKGSFAAHTPGDWIVDTAATATTDGSRHKECTVCGYVTATEVIPATGGTGPTDPAVPSNPADPSNSVDPGDNNGKSPGTGENSNMILWIILAGASLSIFVVMIVAGRKSRKYRVVSR